MVVLASKSPRRKELMKQITSSFSIETKEVDESISYSLPTPLEATLDIAKRKGEIIAKDHFNDIVISADTIVVLGNQILGKPVDKEDAKRMLRLLSNKEHVVITAYALFYKGYVIQNHVETAVKFANLSEATIEAYVATGSPLDKAGSYGYQDNDKEFHIVEYIKGSETNVIGFPVDEIKSDFVRIANCK